MRIVAGLYIVLVGWCGAFAVVWTSQHWHTDDWVRFCTYLAMASVASCLKVSLPRVTTTISGSFFLLLLAIAELGLTEALAIGSAAMLVQGVWHATKPIELRQAAFNTGNAALSVTSAYSAFHWLGGFPDITLPLRIAAAALVYFAVNSWTVTMVIALTEQIPAIATWKRCYLWSLPSYLLAAALVSVYTYMSSILGWQLALLFIPASYAVYDGYRVYVEKLEQERRHEEERRLHAEQISTLHLRTVEALASAIESKDYTTHRHLRRVQIFAAGIAAEIGLAPQDIEALRAAAVLHDIGKISVPESIIAKPGKLTPDEFARMKMHPVVGAEIVSHVRFPYPVAPIVRSHHEKWDGTGYPDGLRGEEIPVGARILAVVDCFDALASDRQYRPALSLERSMQVVEAESGKAFDPRIVDALKRKYIELQSTVEKSVDDADTLTQPALQTLALATAQPATGFEQGGGVSDSIPCDQVFEQRRRALAGRIRRTLELAGGIGAALAEVSSGVEFDTAVVFSVDSGDLVPLHATGTQRSALTECRGKVGIGVAGWVAQFGAPILNGNPAVDATGDLAGLKQFRSALAVPVIRCGRTAGVAVLYRANADSFTFQEMATLEAFAGEIYPWVAGAARKLRVVAAAPSVEPRIARGGAA